ncbi:Peptide methionine sulfoxide reductase [Hondaea fermentalgiana]|uniref:peptide-methionine (S)-S-oxide reductase n=1 Tax=Hondaea fermentalgiana TaxID=2315210 RepID=A0A2R5GA55_9STRA|nr:Peptide methionine sulfoxide reductase [Hondaea fermentalgiana]|eukprot:GBG25423.1 Peptide methionine sulfoxide reductase [Hondaea fermentalgiana]
MQALLQREVPSSGTCALQEAQTATFAAGCFWVVELRFQRIPGVVETQVGYTGGHMAHPTYDDVLSDETGHAEAVEVAFDPEVVSFRELADVFFEMHDPTTLNRQGNDHGRQYRSAIFFHSKAQETEAKEALADAQKLYSNSIKTQIVPASEWWPAEEYHQRYLSKGGQSASKGDLSPIRCYG